MAFIQPTSYFSDTARHHVSIHPIDSTSEIVTTPIMIWEGLNANTVINAVVMIADTAFTDGTNPIKYSLEVHTQDIQVPVTTDTRLITNLGLAQVNAGAINAYTYFDLGFQAMLPLRAIVKHALGTASVADDARFGQEKYDLVIRSSAKASQAGNLFVNILSFQLFGPTFVQGTTGSCCSTGFTPSSN